MEPLEERFDRETNASESALESQLVRQHSLDGGHSPDTAGLNEESVEVESNEKIRSGEEFSRRDPRAYIEEKPVRKGDRSAMRRGSDHLDPVATRLQRCTHGRDPDVRAAPFWHVSRGSGYEEES
jgi:hypothetical protein